MWELKTASGRRVKAEHETGKGMSGSRTIRTLKNWFGCSLTERVFYSLLQDLLAALLLILFLPIRWSHKGPSTQTLFSKRYWCQRPFSQGPCRINLNIWCFVVISDWFILICTFEDRKMIVVYLHNQSMHPNIIVQIVPKLQSFFFFYIMLKRHISCIRYL